MKTLDIMLYSEAHSKMRRTQEEHRQEGIWTTDLFGRTILKDSAIQKGQVGQYGQYQAGPVNVHDVNNYGRRYPGG